MESKFSDSTCLEKEFSQQDSSIEFSVVRSSSLLDFLNYSDCITQAEGEPAGSSLTETSAPVSSEHIFQQSNLRKQWIASVSILSFSLMVITITFIMVFLTHGEVITYLHMDVLNVRYHPAMKNKTSKQFKEISVPFCHEINRYIKSSYLSEIQKGCTLKNITKSHSYIGLGVLLAFKNSNKLSSPDQIRDIIISKSNLQLVNQKIYIKINRFLIPYKSLRVHLIKAVSSAAPFFIKETDNHLEFAVPNDVDENTTWNYHLQLSTNKNVTDQTSSVTMVSTEMITDANTETGIIHDSIKRQENSLKAAVTTPSWTSYTGVWGYRFLTAITSKSFDLQHSKELSDVFNFLHNKTPVEKSSDIFTNLTRNISEDITGLDVGKGHNNQSEITQVNLSITTLTPHRENNIDLRTKQENNSHESINVKTGINIKPSGSGWLAIPFQYLTRGSAQSKRNSSSINMNIKHKQQNSHKELPAEFGIINSNESVTVQNYMANTDMNKDNPLRGSNNLVEITNNPFDLSEKNDSNIFKSTLIPVKTDKSSYKDYIGKQRNLNSDIKNIPVVTNSQRNVTDMLSDIIMGDNNSTLKLPVDTFDETTIRTSQPGSESGNKAIVSDLYLLSSSPNVTRNQLETEKVHIASGLSQDHPNAIISNSDSTTNPFKDILSSMVTSTTNDRPKAPGMGKGNLTQNHTHMRNIGLKSTDESLFMQDVSITPLTNKYLNKSDYIDTTSRSSPNRDQQPVILQKVTTKRSQQDFIALQASTTNRILQAVVISESDRNRDQQGIITSQKPTTNWNQQIVGILQSNRDRAQQNVDTPQSTRNRDQQGIDTAQKPTTNVNQHVVDISQLNRDWAKQDVGSTQPTGNRDQLSGVTLHEFTTVKGQLVAVTQKSIIDLNQQDASLQMYTVTVTAPYHRTYTTVEPPPPQHSQGIVSPTIPITESNTDTTVWSQDLNLLKNTVKADNDNLTIRAGHQADFQIDNNIKKEQPTDSEENIGVTAFMSAGFGWVKIPVNKTLPDNNIRNDTHYIFTKKGYKKPMKLSTVTESMKGSLLASIITNNTDRLTTNQNVDVTNTKPLHSFHPTQNSTATRLNVIKPLDSNVLASFAPEEELVTSKITEKNVIYMVNHDTSIVNPLEINANTNYNSITNTLNITTAFTPNITQRKVQHSASTESSPRSISTEIKHLQNVPTFGQNKSLTQKSLLNVTSDLLQVSSSKWSQDLTKTHPLHTSVPQFKSDTTQNVPTTSNQFISSPKFISDQQQFTNNSSNREAMTVSSPKPLTSINGFITPNPPYMGLVSSSNQSVMKLKVTRNRIPDNVFGVKAATATASSFTATQSSLEKKQKTSNS
ncbi:Hypothetical predicted protein [Octopus vulgaris]|uniref:SEA domain-containing protein n=1 Tax=Octopus vulgaris TaxID=6645 RepID=A0AA36F8C9_OCTVU|nr:Hypothetical predicted protein [Octopus vulgaris]